MSRHSQRQATPASEAVTPKPTAKHIGSTLDSMFKEEGTLDEVIAATREKVAADDARATTRDEYRTPDWVPEAREYLTEFHKHPEVAAFLSDRSTGIVDAQGRVGLRRLEESDRAGVIKVLMPFKADSRIARFCGIGPKDN